MFSLVTYFYYHRLTFIYLKTYNFKMSFIYSLPYHID